MAVGYVVEDVCSIVDVVSGIGMVVSVAGVVEVEAAYSRVVVGSTEV